MSEKRAGRIVRRKEIEAAAKSFSHPWNPSSRVVGTRMSELGGLERTGVSRATLAPGRESFVLHSHLREEEWIYVLEGRGALQIDDEVHEIGPGDFAAFPTPSSAHHLRNPHDEPLVYLMGGECRAFEVAEFPELGRRLFRAGPEAEWCELEALRPLFERPEPEKD